MPYNQQMRALDQQPNLAKLADILQSTRSAGNQYSVPNWVPLLGGSGVGDLFLGKSPEEIENWSYGNAPMQIPEMSRVPQFKKGRAQSLADTAMLLSGPVENTARNAAAGNVGMIIKPKGGNWVNDVTKHADFRELATDLPEQFPRDWLDKKLASYVKNEMATPEDPIRKIAEEWPEKRNRLVAEQSSKKDKLLDLLNRYQIEPVPENVADVEAWRNARTRTANRDLRDVEKEINRLENYNPLHYNYENGLSDIFREAARDAREKANYPQEGLAKTQLGKDWETLSDYSIKPKKIKSYLEQTEYLPAAANLVEENPWMNKLDPDTVVYRSAPSILEYTGLDKLAHGLGRAVSDTNLPEHLQLDPAKLNKVSIPQAVEHVAKINDWDKYKGYEEASRNPSLFEYKDYPDQGLSLIEFKLPPKYDGYYLDLLKGPEDFDKLQLIEDTSYRKAVSEGLDPESDDFRYRVDELAEDMFHKQHRENILREALKFEGAKMNNCVGGYCDDVSSGSSRVFSIRDRRGEPHVTIETKKGYGDNDLERIVQIKGKQNEMPNAKYFPAIQDFVRSKDWSMVHDLPNSGLKRLESIGKTLHPDLYKAATDKYGKFITDEELNALHNDFYERNKDIPIEGFAEGGLVGTPPTTYDPMKVADIVESIDAPQNYAGGGSVDKDSLQLNKPQRTPNHPTKSHIVKTIVDGKEKIIRFGEQGAETAGKPKEGESARMTAKREAFKARHAKNIAKGPSSAAYWADKVKWAEGGEVNEFKDPEHERLYRRAMAHYDDLMAA